MTEEELRAAIIAVLRTIAPEADYARLRPAESIRDQLDIDSMDLVNFVIGLHERLGVDVPEADYGRLATLDGCLRYLAPRLATAGAQQVR